jgi:hypothetical protein
MLAGFAAPTYLSMPVVLSISRSAPFALLGPADSPAVPAPPDAGAPAAPDDPAEFAAPATPDLPADAAEPAALALPAAPDELVEPDTPLAPSVPAVALPAAAEVPAPEISLDGDVVADDALSLLQPRIATANMSAHR